MVRVAIRSSPPPHRSFWDEQGDVGRGRQTQPQGPATVMEGGCCMGLVMTAMRIGLRWATTAISVLPQSVESTKKYLFIRTSKFQDVKKQNV